MNNKLSVRNYKKARKPKFIRQDGTKVKFKNKWRSPQGLHNKRRLNKAGHQRNPSSGYSSPRDVKYLTKEGYKRILVNTFTDLEKVDKAKDIIVLSSKLGLKKKIAITEKAIAMGFKIENIKDPNKFVQDQKSLFEERKKDRKKKIEEKEKSKKELIKKAKEKEEKKDEESSEKQEDLKEEIMSTDQKEHKTKELEGLRKDTHQSKTGHVVSGVPGNKQ